jgi:hypothetical protein
MTSTTRRRATLWILAGSIALAPVAAAQQDEPARPAETPLPRPSPRPVGPTTRPRVDPVQPGRPDLRKEAIPGLEDSDFKIGPAPLLSERTTLALRRGSMVKLPTGERVFLFHADAGGRADRPMVLLASQKLQQMEQVAADRDEPPVFLLTGQVYVYQGINYLLPTAYSMVQPPSSGGEGQAPPPPPPAATDPQVQDLIKQLEAQRRGPRALERTTPAEGAARPSAGEADQTKGLLPEGQAVVRRRGRMVRGGAGEWEFVFDRGAAGDPSLDRPMTLAPSLNLQRMEAFAAQKGDAASFEVSGQVRIYRGRNHLVPTLFQVYLDNELEPRQ